MYMQKLNSQKSFLSSKAQSGFTLIEIMIVLVILGGLMAILGKNVMSSLNKSRQKQAYIQIREIAKQLDTYNLDCGQYPTTEQGLQALVTSPGSDVCPNWGPEPYMKSIPKDSWNTAFQYESDGTKYKITSYGKDKLPGGTGLARDITSDDDETSAAK